MEDLFRVEDMGDICRDVNFNIGHGFSHKGKVCLKDEKGGSVDYQGAIGFKGIVSWKMGRTLVENGNNAACWTKWILNIYLNACVDLDFSEGDFEGCIDGYVNFGWFGKYNIKPR